jgi:hypothetical protein
MGTGTRLRGIINCCPDGAPDQMTLTNTHDVAASATREAKTKRKEKES